MPRYLSLPADSAGLAPASSSTEWVFGTAVSVSASLPSAIHVVGIQFQNTDIPSTDVNQDILFEVTVGGTTKLQVPFNMKADTLVGYNFTSTASIQAYYFPEPYVIPAGSNVEIKVTDSIAAALTYGGVKLLYEENDPATVALNSPDDEATVSDTTPTLDFTGTDPDGDDIRYNVQVDTVNTFDSVPGGEGAVIDSYSESNQVGELGLSSDIAAAGQTLTGDGTILGSSKFYLQKVGTPTGNAVVKIYAHTGTFGSDGTPTGAALATSDNFDVSTLTTSFQLIEFAFSGANQITLTNTTKYCAVLEYTATDTDYIELGNDNTSPTHTGNQVIFSNSFGTWLAITNDVCFYVNGVGAGTPLLDKVSGTDSGFDDPDSADTDPFTSGNNITYEVQGGDELADDTYYWRVRAIDPAGSNTYGAWSATRSFEVTSGYTVVHSGDANKRKATTTSHTTNANKKKGTTRTHTADSSKKIVPTRSHTADSYLRLATEVYSRATTTSLPADDAELATSFSAQDYTDVDTDDDVYVSTKGLSYLVFQFKDRAVDSSSPIVITCIAKTRVAPSVKPALLQIYNRTSEEWETLDTENTAGAETEFTLSGTQSTNLSDYYSDTHQVSCRVYQGAI